MEIGGRVSRNGWRTLTSKVTVGGRLRYSCMILIDTRPDLVSEIMKLHLMQM